MAAPIMVEPMQPSQSGHLRFLAQWVRAASRTHVRLAAPEADILLCGIGNAFERLVLSPQAGQRLASLLDELSAQAVIQTPVGAQQHIKGRV
jgi:hypothetical protein